MATVIWFTGLSGSGKSTIAEALKKELEGEQKKVEILDGDVVRNTLHKNLGFSREDIRENNCLIAELAKKSSADIVLVPIISPYREDREMARKIITHSSGKTFCELFVNCSLRRCIERDVKGLYEKAKRGEITNMIGFSEVPYEVPLQPDIEVHTERESKEQCVQKIVSSLSFSLV